MTYAAAIAVKFIETVEAQEADESYAKLADDCEETGPSKQSTVTTNASLPHVMSGSIWMQHGVSSPSLVSRDTANSKGACRGEGKDRGKPRGKFGSKGRLARPKGSSHVPALPPGAPGLPFLDPPAATKPKGKGKAWAEIGMLWLTDFDHSG